jgi:uncharacterized membrane protein YkoI
MDLGAPSASSSRPEGLIMKRSIIAVITLVAAMSAIAKPPTQAELQKEAKISMDKARATALKKVPGGKIESAELEREHGKLIYSFDIKTSKPGVTEVNVDAITGKIVSSKQETPAKEAAEKKQEAKEKH